MYISSPTDPSPTTHLVLVRDSIGDQLESIIRARRVTARTLTDQPTHIIRRLPLRLIQHKSISEVLDSLWLKARQPTIQHQLNNMTQVIAMLATRKKCLDGELLEPLVALRGSGAAHDSDHLGGKLERSALEFDPTGRDIEAESEVDVDDVTPIVDHDIAVMSVFELQQERDDAVRRHALDEIRPRFLEANAILVAVAAHEVVIESVHGFAA